MKKSDGHQTDGPAHSRFSAEPLKRATEQNVEAASLSHEPAFHSGKAEGRAQGEARANLRKTPARAEVSKRLKLRSGRYFLDLRNLGKGREALIPDGQSYSTKDELVAISLAGKRLQEVLIPEHERHFRTHLTRAVTLGQFSREWIARARDLAGDGFAKPITLLRYEQAFAQLFRVLDQDTLTHRLTISDIKHAIRTLRKTVTRKGGFTSASSIHQIITGMQLVYDHASDEGVVLESYNPWRNLRSQDRPSLPRQSTTDFLEIYEGHALLLGCEDWILTEIPLRAIVSTLLHTGGRKTEVLGLEWSDVDFARKMVRFRANAWREIKDYDERSVPLWPDLERDLLRHRDKRTTKSELVFEGKSNTGEPQMITSYHKPFAHAKWAAGARLGDVLGAKLLAKEVNPRAMRVTYCSARIHTLDRGQPVAPWTLRKEMGHNSDKMIDRVYGRIGTVRHRSEVVEYVSFEILHAGEARTPDLEVSEDGDRAA